MKKRSPVAERIQAKLVDLEHAGLKRTLRAPAGIDFCSNDYLGLAAHPRVKAEMTAAVEHYGCGSGGSRLMRGQRDAFDRLESRFARFKGVDSSLYFSSGYLANLAAISTMAEAGDTIFSDELNHASLIDSIRLSRAARSVFPHADTQELARQLKKCRPGGGKIIVTESLFSMDGDIAPLREYARLAEQAGAVLIVDEAHAVGVFGAAGSGLIQESGIDDSVLLSINPAGKALGVAGGFVAGPSWAIEFLKQSARSFIFSTAPPPALAAAIEAALDVVESQPERRTRLLENAAFLRKVLAAHGVPIPAGRSHVVPVVIGPNRETIAIAADMQTKGFDVRAIRPPSVPAGTARLRVSVNAGLSRRDIENFSGQLVQAISRFAGGILVDQSPGSVREAGRPVGTVALRRNWQ